MESFKFKKLTSIGALFFTILATSYANPPKSIDVPEFNREEVEKRIKELDNLVVSPVFNAAVEGYLKTYTVRRRDLAERILGRQVLYFPIFEQELKKQNLPESLKYLPVVESALVPKAVSRAAAVGLWQFMNDTGKEYGLKINSYVDERCDPIKSTEAALKFLTFLHNKYNDWALAIAAYNSGSGRVSRAIKRSRSKNFWNLSRYLPRETRNYVPAFIAASYLLRHYEHHDLVPLYPELDLQITETIPVFASFTFHQIAEFTDLPLQTIEELNPAYRKGFIPSSVKGNYLTLPKRVMPAFKDFLEAKRPDNLYHAIEASPVLVERPLLNSDAHYFKAIYVVQKDQTIYNVAKMLKCSVHQLIAWNNLKNSQLKQGQELIIYLPKEIKRLRSYKELIKVNAFDPIPSLKFIQEIPRESIYKQEKIDFAQLFKERYLYYEARKKEKLSKIAKRLSGVSLEDLIKLNDLPGDYIVKPGSRIKIKRFY